MNNAIALTQAWQAYSDGNYPQAAHISAAILQREPNNVLALACRAMAHVWIDEQIDPSIRSLKKLIKRAPQVPMLHDFLGRLHSYRGDMDLARASFETALALEPDNPDHYFNLTTVTKFTAFDDLAAKVQALYDAMAANGQTEDVRLCGALAKIYDDLGAYEKAMDYCMKANRAAPGTYMPAGFNAHLAALRALPDAQALRLDTTSGLGSDKPVFIVGMPRSGTTLAETILARHPDVYACGELPDVMQIEQRLVGRYPQLRGKPAAAISMLTLANETDLKAEAKAFLDRVTARGGRFKRFIDKMPSDFMRVGLIAKLFPNARIIHMRRNPIDCSISNLFARFNASHAYTNRQDWLGHFYRISDDVMGEWKRLDVLPIFDLHYEELVADPERVTRALLDFLDLEWTEQCLDSGRSTNGVRTASVWQARQPINSRSVDKWRRYEPWIGELIEALGGYEALGVEPGARPDAT